MQSTDSMQSLSITLFFIELEMIILIFTWKHTHIPTRVAEEFYMVKELLEISNFKLCYRAIVIKNNMDNMLLEQKQTC